MEEKPRIRISPKGTPPGANPPVPPRNPGGDPALQARLQEAEARHRAFRRRVLIGGGALAALLLTLTVLLLARRPHPQPPPPADTLARVQEVRNEREYGLNFNDFLVEKKALREGEGIAGVLRSRGIDTLLISRLIDMGSEQFDMSAVKTGDIYFLLYSKTFTSRLEYFIYEPNPYAYVTFSLGDSLYVEGVEREVDQQVQARAVTIRESLWQTVLEDRLPFELVSKLEDALSWAIDFYEIRPGDQMKVIYEERLVNGEAVGIGQLLAVEFMTRNKPVTAYYFENDGAPGFFNEEGRPMKTAFLLAPVKYSRISSFFNLNRTHPVLRLPKPHLGTDYAAPEGTPIFSVADGVVTEAAYKSNNGNYVKVKHDETYQSQYLHMQDFAQGIRPGVRVKQGQVIGYVGSTGLSTGPHVCFRFWKNGQQVNHLAENLPQAEPIEGGALRMYAAARDSLQRQLIGLRAY
jgi:murein DD-endopeptidase MepM/ murein hydrolase activator NlpD